MNLKGWRSWLNVHGAQRLAERTSFLESDFLALLDAGKSAPVGIEEKTNRLHRLVYSVKDDDCFVAVQDMANGEVITVLTLEYHENLAWKLSSDSQNLARKLAWRWHRGTQPREYPLGSAGVLPRTSLRLSASLSVVGDPWSLPAFRYKALGSVPIAALDQPLDSLETSISFCQEVRQRLKDRNVEISTVRRIFGRLGGNKRTAQVFEYGIDFLTQGRRVEDSA